MLGPCSRSGREMWRWGTARAPTQRLGDQRLPHELIQMIASFHVIQEYIFIFSSDELGLFRLYTNYWVSSPTFLSFFFISSHRGLYSWKNRLMIVAIVIIKIWWHILYFDLNLCSLICMHTYTHVYLLPNVDQYMSLKVKCVIKHDIRKCF